MRVGESVRKAIDDWELGEVESATLHACNAVDGTAAKVFPNERRNRTRFVQLLRANYGILGPMGVPGIELTHSRFNVPTCTASTGDKFPDVADVIYGIHRCTHGHGDELPAGFELLPAAINPFGTRMHVGSGKIQFSDRLIFGLLAVAVMSPVNADQRVPESYFLSHGHIQFVINDWWGRYDEFCTIMSTLAGPLITWQQPTPAPNLAKE